MRKHRQRLARVLVEALPAEIVRPLLSDWQFDAPGDAGLALLRAKFEFRDRCYCAALRWAKHALESKPGDAEAELIRDKCLTALQNVAAMQ